jgi:hypothetical protein
MRLIFLTAMMYILVGCSSFDIKRTDFYKDGRKVASVTGKGIFESDEWGGTHKVWARKGYGYYQVKCNDCEIVETNLGKR